MAFDPDKYLKEKEAQSSQKFDPDAYLASKALPKSRKGEAALQGFGESATLGYLPRIQAATEPAFTKLADLITGQDVSERLPEYAERREQYQQRSRELAEQEPGAYAGGVIGGALATPAIGAGRIAAAPTAAGRIARAAGVGAGTGAAYDPGTEEAFSPEALKARASQAVAGGATGAGVRTGAEGIKQLLRPIAATARWMAGMRKPEAEAYARDVKGVRNIRRMAEEGRELELADQARDVGKAGVQNIRKTIEQAGEELDDILRGKTVEVPGRGPMDAIAANRLRRTLDKQAGYKPGRLYTEQQAAKLDEFKQQADEIRKAISAQIPEARPINERMAEAYRVKDYLNPKIFGDDPGQVFRSTAEKDVAALQRAENLGAENLVNYSRLRSAARATDPLGGGALGFAGAAFRVAGQGGILGADKATRGADRLTGERLIRILNQINRRDEGGAK